MVGFRGRARWLWGGGLNVDVDGTRFPLGDELCSEEKKADAAYDQLLFKVVEQDILINHLVNENELLSSILEEARRSVLSGRADTLFELDIVLRRAGPAPYSDSRSEWNEELLELRRYAGRVDDDDY